MRAPTGATPQLTNHSPPFSSCRRVHEAPAQYWLHFAAKPSLSSSPPHTTCHISSATSPSVPNVAIPAHGTHVSSIEQKTIAFDISSSHQSLWSRSASSLRELQLASSCAPASDEAQPTLAPSLLPRGRQKPPRGKRRKKSKRNQLLLRHLHLLCLQLLKLASPYLLSRHRSQRTSQTKTSRQY